MSFHFTILLLCGQIERTAAFVVCQQRLKASESSTGVETPLLRFCLSDALSYFRVSHQIGSSGAGGTTAVRVDGPHDTRGLRCVLLGSLGERDCSFNKVAN